MLKAHALYEGAREIAAMIAPIETSLSDTLALQAQLLAQVPTVQTKAGLDPAVAHAAVLRLIASINATAHAQTEFIAAHREFADVRGQLRLVERGFGSLPGCPESGELRLVDSAAA